MSKKIIIMALILSALGAGVSYAYFVRTTGDEGFGYGYGYGYGLEYGYGYGWHQLEIDGDEKLADHGFPGDDGAAIDVSATATRTTITVDYTTEYTATNSINYGRGSKVDLSTSGILESADDHSVTISNLQCGRSYSYRVESEDVDGNSWYTSTATISTLSCGGGGGGGGGTPPTPPAPPKLIASGLTQAQIDSIILVLQTFGADAATIARVREALEGGAPLTPRPIVPPGLIISQIARNLTVGSQGEDVRQLQQFLNARGFAVAASGPGSVGNETTYFGPLTRAALARFQTSANVNPPQGFFGPITRAYLQSVGY